MKFSLAQIKKGLGKLLPEKKLKVTGVVEVKEMATSVLQSSDPPFMHVIKLEVRNGRQYAYLKGWDGAVLVFKRPNGEFFVEDEYNKRQAWVTGIK